MRIAITGASGLVGSALAPHLESRGHEVIRLQRAGRPGRGGKDAGAHTWSPERGLEHPERLGTIDALVHLAGESVAGARWSPTVKARIRDSRVGPTRALAQSLATLAQLPHVMVSASAIGYYGDRGNEPLTEQSPPGNGFLADVCRDWERATEPASAAGVRVATTRFGIILDAHGGALGKMRLPFSLGLGGRLGSGEQIYSWVAIADVVGALTHAVERDALRGPVNVTAPHPVSNAEFTRTLGRVLHRPAVIPVPAFALRAAVGELADAELLSSKRVLPAALEAADYQFAHPQLEGALRATLDDHRGAA
ncbi:MAG TPA: TIGR01777 family oxidoreductase [Luteitalea sp.]|nr:TIGR01777 family oxidoreductase [Luteitalea sp.]